MTLPVNQYDQRISRVILLTKIGHVFTLYATILAAHSLPFAMASTATSCAVSFARDELSLVN